ncbi:MAG: HAD family phosphatase [Sinobacteraceae bacterium]|nr:HAD family phosphatase [Nevskiaceae bacterium]
MRYLVLCCDYDGTLATEGEVFPETAAAVERLLASGRRLVLVTGRELDELKTVCHCLRLFEYVVAENGALLYHPATDTETPLAQRPPDAFIAALKARGVERVSVGRVIVATWEPYETVVLETIRDQGLELQVIFNKGAVMVLPAGVNKASGLAAALEKLCLSAHNAVGIGDAENDHALLGLCEFGAAVANALPTLKEKADLVTRGARGAGVTELIDELLKDDLASHDSQLTRHHLRLGTRTDGAALDLSPYGQSVTLLGAAGPRRHGIATRLLQQLAECDYTFCLIDPAREFVTLSEAVTLGSAERVATLEEVIKLLRSPGQCGVIDLSALAGTQAAAYANELLSQLLRLKAQAGLPHWLALNATERMAPLETDSTLLQRLPSRLVIGTEARQLGRAWLAATDLLLLSGPRASESLRSFCEVSNRAVPPQPPEEPAEDELLAWWPAQDAAPFRLRITGRS